MTAPIVALAQIGDHPGEVEQPQIPPELIPPAPPLSPADAIKSFKLQPGFHIECVASEPLVEDPVVAQFDPDGRLWVVEMRGFMPDVDGTGEDAPIGRIVVLTSAKGNGIMDHSTVFLDGLVLPRALTFVDDGVLVGAPPHLWFCRDTNGDGIADEKIEVASDYGVAVDPKRPQLANPERAPNSLLWDRDNWIYSAAYMGRFRREHGKWKRSLTTFRGQWGLSQDEAGDLFYNSNSDQLRYDAIPSYYLGRNPNFPHPEGDNVNAAENQLCWPARVSPGTNRGYKKETLRNGRLKEFTSACAPFVFYSDLFPPEFHGNVFVAEPAANLVRRNVLSETNGVIKGVNALDKTEFLASTDERFRPVNFTAGPDGALYVVDMYHGVIQHRISLTTYLRNQSLSRGLDKPLHMGRIYRVVPDGKTPSGTAHFSSETPVEWVSHLSNPNAWWRDTAQRLLVEKRDPATVPALEGLAAKGAEAVARLQALWTLEGMDALEERTVQRALKDPDGNVRAAAVRLCETFFDSEDKPELLDSLRPLASDTDPAVQLQLALTLGEAHDAKSDLLMANLALSSRTNAFLPDAILSGVHGRELELLAKLVDNDDWQKPDATAGRVLGGLVSCVIFERNPERIARLIDLIADTKRPLLRRLLLDGIVTTSKATTRKPVKLHEAPMQLLALGNSVDKRIATGAQKSAALMIWPGKPGVKEVPPPPPLTADQQRRFDAGKTLFLGVCAACHQPHGMGMDGLAPPLVDSEWVMGSEQRLARILLKGVQGPIKVEGASYSLDMPSMGIFDDDQIACLLTYIRREWDNTGAPVEPETIKKIRADIAQRQEAWTSLELLKTP